MAKSIKDAGAKAFDNLTGGKGTKGVQDTYKAHDTPIEYVRLNLRIPKSIREYLEAAAWEESTMTRRVSVTAYLVELVEKDMRERPDIVEKLEAARAKDDQ